MVKIFGEEEMKVNELSKRTGINLETIRYYEKQGIIEIPKEYGMFVSRK